MTFPLWVFLSIAWLPTAPSLPHPSTIPVARAKIQTNGLVEVDLRFDILAFALEEDPTIIKDEPMNALLDGTDEALESLLNEAKARFLDGTAAAGGTLEDVSFPTVTDIRKEIASAPPPRLPVMAHAHFRVKLAPVMNRFSMRFPPILGTVVLSAERPYMEPVSIPVEPNQDSDPVKIPSEAEVANLKEQFRKNDEARAQTTALPTHAEAQKAIQAQYDRWTEAYKKHDVNTLLAVLSPGYTLKTVKGTTLTLAEYKTILEVQKKKKDDTTAYKTEMQRINLQGAVAAVYSRETTTNRTPKPGSKEAVTVTYQHDYIDVWEFREGQWRLKSTVTLKEQPVSGG